MGTGRHVQHIPVYIGTYTRREAFVNGKADGIYIYDLDPATGELTYAATIAAGAGTINPSFLTVAPGDRFLYAVNEITGSQGPSGTLSAFAIYPVNKKLSYLNRQSTHGLAPCYVSIEPEGYYALVANYETGSICVLPIQADGGLGEATDVVQFTGAGPHPERQEGPHAHMIVPGPDGRYIFAVDLGTDRLMVYRLDSERGKLVPADPPWTALPPGTGPRHLAFHQQLPFAYVISELQSTVTVFHYEARSGKLEPLQTLSTLPGDFTGGNLGAAIKVAPSGRFVYASNRGHDSLAIYGVDHVTGELSVVGHESAQGKSPRDFAIDPTGTLLLVANQDSDSVVTFWVDKDSGLLRATGHGVTVPKPVCLHVANG